MARKNFTDKIKEQAAQKVGYFCSYSGCRRITIGSNTNRDKAIKIGEAAHIYPASKKGPRYDEKISEDFIKSEANCIWLCSTHHTIVDKDDDFHTAELLLKWKKEAEIFASEQLKLSTINFDDISQKKYDIELLDHVFNEYLIDGKIMELLSLIRKFETVNNDTNLYQLFSYYKIQIYYYNNVDLLDEELDFFVSIDNKYMMNNLIIFFIENLEVDFLLKLKIFVPENLKGFYNAVINNEIEGQIVKFIKDPKSANVEELDYLNDENLEMKNKMFSNYLFNNIKLPNIPKNNPFTSDKTLFSDGFIYKVRSYLYSLSIDITLNNVIIDKEIWERKEFIWLQSIEDKIKNYSFDYQKAYWHFILTIYSYHGQYNEKINEAPLFLKKDPIISLLKISSQLKNNINEINYKELFSVSNETQNFQTLFLYLSLIDKEKMENIFTENKELATINSDFLALYAEHFIFTKKTITIRHFIEKFEKTYDNDFLFNLIIMKYKIENNENLEKIRTKLETILNESTMISSFALHYYIDVLIKLKDYEALIELLDWNTDIETRFKLAKTLLIETPENFEIIKDFLDKNTKIYSNHPLLYNCLGHYFLIKKNNEKALECYKKAFDKRKSDELAYDYFAFKSNTFHKLTHEEVLFCENSSNYYLQSILINYYLSELDFEKAKEKFIYYFALTEGKEESMFAMFFRIINQYPQEKKSKHLDKGYTATLKSENENIYIKISIHKNSVLKSQSGQTFLDTINYSKEDPRIENLLFRTLGDEVSYLNNKYIIIQVENTEAVYSRSLITYLESKGMIEAYRSTNGDDPKEALNQIIDLVEKSRKGHQSIIDLYNNHKIIPISLFIKKRGKELMNTMEFLLFNNSEKIDNNSGINLVNKKILVSYDVIIQTFLLNEVDASFFNEFDLYVSRSTYEEYIRNIRNETIDLYSDSASGYLTTIEDGVKFVKNTESNKAVRKKHLRKLEKFIESMHIIDQSDLKFENILLDMMKDKEFNLEFDLFNILIQNHELSFLTDNLFLSITSIELGISYYGLMNILNKYRGSKREKLLKVLSNCNYKNIEKL